MRAALPLLALSEKVVMVFEKRFWKPRDAVLLWADDTVGRWSMRQDFDRLADPVGDRVLFAGEHTDRDWYQTVHGALRSGLREARRLGVQEFEIPGLEGR